MCHGGDLTLVLNTGTVSPKGRSRPDAIPTLSKAGGESSLRPEVPRGHDFPLSERLYFYLEGLRQSVRQRGSSVDGYCEIACQ